MFNRFNGPYRLYEGADWYEKFWLAGNEGMVIKLPARDEEGKGMGEVLLFKCPCLNLFKQCGTVVLPVNPVQVEEKWGYKFSSGGLLTLTPSIWQKGTPSCGSHYSINNGMVQWG